MAATAECDVVMAATEPELLEDEDAKREAESFKEQGNAYYAKKDYNEAYNYYTKAIDMCPNNASYYGNRAATLMMLGRFREALGDAQQSVRDTSEKASATSHLGMQWRHVVVSKEP
uniref:DnaJ heat shock protein family (Hsp40) member C7 n=1 Tax=Mus musculus TaxID=10090 RepID=A0A6I8MWZ5_MOUSE